MHHAQVLFLAQSLSGRPLIKKALIADSIENAMGGGAMGTMAGIGASFIPGVMSVDSLHDAGRSALEGWGRFRGGDIAGGLRSGAKLVGNVGLAALGLIPGVGGGAAKLLKGIGSAAPKVLGAARGINAIGRNTSNLARIGNRASQIGGRVVDNTLGKLESGASNLIENSGVSKAITNTRPGQFAMANPGISHLGGQLGVGSVNSWDAGKTQQNLDRGSEMGSMFKDLVSSNPSGNPIWQTPPSRPTFFSGNAAWG